jgi:Tfp pilus assembly protein PilX
LKINSSQKPCGVALIVVMIAIAVFSALAAALAFSMKVETKLAMNADHEQALLWLGRSGVEYARWILAQEAAIPNQPYDALIKSGRAGRVPWAKPTASWPEFPWTIMRLEIKKPANWSGRFP